MIDRIAVLKQRGVIVRETCWCGVCRWAYELPKVSGETLRKRRIAKAPKKRRKS